MSLRSLVIATLLMVVSCTESPVVQAPFAEFSDGLLGSIEPQGWLKENLERQMLTLVPYGCTLLRLTVFP